MWYVYFLPLGNGDSYVGSTNDLRHRIATHRAGKVTSTKASQPVALKSYVAVPIEKAAHELERCFKSGSGKAFAKRRFWKAGHFRLLVAGHPCGLTAEGI